MRTTIALDSRHRDRLRELKQRWGLRSVDEVVARLLTGPPMSAHALYRHNRRQVDEVLKRHKVRRLVAFGSRARGDAGPASDLDLAVRLPNDADLFDLIAVKDDLREAFGVEVDVVELAGLKPRIRKRVESEGVVLYERT